jgi:uncharacterized repeat protein (TIGR03803 family)
LLADGTGALYGTTAGGGKYDYGTVFKLTPSKSGYSERILWSFRKDGDGRQPKAGLIADASGALYGTTFEGGTSARCVASGSVIVGCGTVFKLTPRESGYSESVLWSFYVAVNDGDGPNAGLLLDPSGALYGTTSVGGTHTLGTVFELTPSSQGYTETVIWNFGKGKDGQLPLAALIMDAKGALYGTTSSGGTKTRRDGAGGTVFKLTPAAKGYKEETLWDFGVRGDGALPAAGLYADGKGALYGVTAIGGSLRCKEGCGTAFKLTPAGKRYKEQILWDFGSHLDGVQPYSTLIADENGDLYGTTELGGANRAPCEDVGCGTVFELMPSGSGYQEAVLWSFGAPNDGALPGVGVVADASGALYGTTPVGGSGALLGTVFKVVP